MPDQPDTRGAVQKAMKPLITVYRDALGGTHAMRDKGETYLPKFEMEEQTAYARRLKQAVFYNATELTVDALVGLVFRTEPELSAELPAEIEQDAENIDLTGRHLAVYAKDFFRDAWDGLAVTFVDMQQGGAETRAEERAMGLRPYWINIKARDVLRARPTNVAGREVLGSFAFRETVTLEDGEFGERMEHRVRDYRLDLSGDSPVVWYRVYAKRDVPNQNKEVWELIEGPDILRVGGTGPDRGAPMDEIPASVCYTGYTGFFDATPPLLDLAYENIDHYQQRSEHRRAWQYARIPIAIFPGMTPEEVVIAPDRGILTPDAEARPYYMETSGQSLEGSKVELLESERRMANMGAQMLYRPDRPNETATARRIENAQSNSSLATAARALQDSLENALRLHAKWRRVELPEATDGRWVTITQDFEDYEMDAQMLAALNNAVLSGNLRLETFLTGLRDGIPILGFIDPEAEAEMLGTEAMDSLLQVRAEMQAANDTPPAEEAA